MKTLISEFSIGLFFWQTLLFVVLVFFLRKFAWKPILSAVEEREEGIKEALESAQKAKAEMENLNADNERILVEAKKERDILLREAREIKDKIIADAKSTANEEAEKIVSSAKEQIENNKMKALIELKNQVAGLSIEMTERILRTELSDRKKQEDFIQQAIKDQSKN